MAQRQFPRDGAIVEALSEQRSHALFAGGQMGERSQEWRVCGEKCSPDTLLFQGPADRQIGYERGDAILCF